VEVDKRNHKRICPEGLAAHIVIDPPPPADEIIMDGQVIDMSYRGIKIKLQQPIYPEIEEAELRILLILPESGVPVTIHGIIRHIQDGQECGLQYVEQHTEQQLDDLMFECVKCVKGVDID